MLRFISSLSMPVFLLVLVYFAYPRVVALTGEQFVIIKFFPLVLAIGLLLLCLRFNRSRLFFATLALVLLYATLLWGLPLLAQQHQDLVFSLLCLLLPINLLVFSELRERGVFTWWGFTRFLFLFVPPAVGWFFLTFEPVWLAGILNYRLSANEPLPWLHFSQLAQLSMLISLLIMNGRLFSQATAQRAALFGGLVASLVMLHFYDQRIIVSLLSNAALLMFVIALIQESWSMAYIDHLTDLPGRRALNEHLLKLSGTYCIAMMDIDHFKKFNDRYGHDAGDEVLRMVAARIRKVGVGGKVYRYGGEEFTIVFAGRSVKEVIQQLEDVRESVAASPFFPSRKERRKTDRKKRATKPRGVKVTISIGVTEQSERYPLPEDVIKASDKALYRAKKKGRNRVCA